jgi:uncharacterized cupin superfamily protein
MSARKGFVVPAGGGHPLAMKAPGRYAALKLLGGETDGSIMMFEETVPPGTLSWFHLHHESDEVAWVIEGEITFLIGGERSTGGPGTCAFMPRGVAHAWKNSGGATARVLFLYTPATAGGYVEAMRQDDGKAIDDAERERRLRAYRWEIVGVNPL